MSDEVIDTLMPSEVVNWVNGILQRVGIEPYRMQISEDGRHGTVRFEVSTDAEFASLSSVLRAEYRNVPDSRSWYTCSVALDSKWIVVVAQG